jgi:hypothetical protein
MATSANAKIKIETSNVEVENALMVDSGDHQNFTVTGIKVFSGNPDPTIKPNGITEGRNILSVHVTNDTVTIAAFKAYSKGVEHTVTATTDTITRPATNVSKVNSIIMTDAGAIDVVPGTDGATTAFSETRGAAGGPALLAIDAVEIGQIRVVTSTAGAITADQIKQVAGQHTEYSYLPQVSIVNNIGDGENADVAANKYAYVQLAAALPLIHTGPIAKRIYITYATPEMTDLSRTLDFVPAEKSHSTSSSQYYGGSIASSSESLGQSSFAAIADNNITDLLISLKDKKVTVDFYQDRNKTPFVRSQGVLGISRTFPVADQNRCACTVSCENPSVEYTS